MPELSDTIVFTTIKYDKDHNSITILDQAELPQKEEYRILKTPKEVCQAITAMKVRGAPLIGVTAAYGMVLAGKHGNLEEVLHAATDIKSTRPTAVNLQWAVDRMVKVASRSSNLFAELLKEAERIEAEDKCSCERIGEFGVPLINDGAKIMVYCNAGALATSGIGTALGVLYTARRHGKRFEVYACETRPRLQGARLTSWELTKNNIATCVICDNMAATHMAAMDLVLVGADRIALNGDTANKVGTLGLAIIAQFFKKPFYVVAPTSTIDFATKDGHTIPIEIRDSEEITHLGTQRILPSGIPVFNPSFDVTPHRLITGIITDRGIMAHPYTKSLGQLAISVQASC